MCQIQGWSQPKYQNLKSCLTLHTRQEKTPPPDGWNLEKKKSNLLSFTLFFWQRKKGLFMLNITFPFIKVATLLPGTPANLPPPFFHTWLIRTLDYYLIKGWSPHFVHISSWWHALPCSLFTLQQYQHYLSIQGGNRESSAIPIMNLCVVQKHRDAKPSVYIKNNKYLNYKCLSLFLTWGISGTIPRFV